MTFLGQYLTCLLAFALPWISFLDLPQYNVYPLLFMAGALLLIAVLDAFRRGWQVPFELTLPFLAGIALAVYEAFYQFQVARQFPIEAGLDYYYVLVPFVALAILQVGDSRSFGLTALKIFGISSGVWCFLMLAAAIYEFFPTLFAFSRVGLANGSFYGLVILIFFTARIKGRQRVLLGTLAWATAVAMVLLGLPRLLRLPHLSMMPFDALPTHLYVSFLTSPWLLVGLWPIARIAAKLELDRRESEDKRIPQVLLALLALITIATVRGAGWDLVSGCLIPSLAAVWVLPTQKQKEAWPVGKLTWGIVPLCVLIGFNLFNVNPQNPRDPRNYAPTQEFMLKAYVPMLQAIENVRPDEVQTNYWLAKWHLNNGDLLAAALDYRKSLEDTGSYKPILPPPSPEQRQAFMDALRDKASALPPNKHQGAYALALLAEGKMEDAMALIQRGAVDATTPVNDSAHDALTAAVAAYLWAPGLEKQLDAMSAAQLLGILTSWGVQVDRKASAPCFPVVVIPDYRPVQDFGPMVSWSNECQCVIVKACDQPFAAPRLSPTGAERIKPQPFHAEEVTVFLPPEGQ